jgi:hypothetical protein
MKKQVWLTSEQIELNVACLEFVKKQMADKFSVNATDCLTRIYTTNRVNDLIVKIGDKK